MDLTGLGSAFEFGKTLLNKIIPDPKQRAEAQVLLQQAQDAGHLGELEHELNQEKERSKRHDSDMKSDSWLSKNIRPMSLIFLMFVFTLLALTDGNLHWTFDPVKVEGVLQEAITKKFNIKAVYVTAFVDFLKIAFGFYFVGRTVEKGMALFKK